MRDARRPIVVTAFVMAAALLCAAPALAQDTTATLKGSVRDAAKHGLASVEVTAQSASLPGPLTSKTSKHGEFRLAALPPGLYVVSLSRTGLVPVKLTMRLSAAETAVVAIVMHPQDGDDGAITVSGKQQVFPPSWATSLMSRYTSLEQLPVTGTTRTIVGLVAESPGVRPDHALFLIDGLPLRHGWKLAPMGSFAGPGAETLQELTSSPGRLPPGYGRLESGASEAVTARGANRLSGSIKAIMDGADLNGDLLREARATQGMSGSAEYTLGGALLRDRAWFFASGRNLRQSVDDRTLGTAESFETSTREQLGLARLTLTPRAAHRFEAQWIGARQRVANSLPTESFLVADRLALGGYTLEDRALSAGYLGRVNRWLDLSVRYTRESGSTTWSDPDGSIGIPLIDQRTNAVSTAPFDCAGCTPRSLIHRTLRATADTGFSSRMGTHDLTFGYDTAHSSLAPESDQDGDRFQLRATRSTVANGAVVPVIEPGSSWIVWIPNVDRRVNLRSDAIFLNDHWMPGGRVSLDLGVRFDRNRSTLAADGRTVLAEQALGPRIFANWRISNAHLWTLTAGFGRYVTDPVDRQIEDALGAGTRVFPYQGTSINSTAPFTGASSAIDRVFDWFASAGGTARRPAFALEPALAPDTIAPPHVDEWSVGVGRLFGEDGHARIDLTRRTYGSVAGREVDPGSQLIDQFGRAVDATTATPSTLFERSYTGITLRAKYRFGHWADVDGQYTLSKLSGNAADARIAGALVGPDLAYPEYFDPSWRLPVGSLPDDARHRLRMWAHTELIANDRIGLVVLTAVYSRESGRPYGAAGLVGVESYVTNPGYLNPPPAVLYYFTGRDAFRTDPIGRTDIGLNYRRRLPGTVHGDVFAAFHILNLANNTVVIHPERLVVVNTAYTDPSLQRFNPFTQLPVQGVHWTMADAAAGGSVATTLPRTFRFTVGIRF